jgi:hypothetical protein
MTILVLDGPPVVSIYVAIYDGWLTGISRFKPNKSQSYITPWIKFMGHNIVLLLPLRWMQWVINGRIKRMTHNYYETKLCIRLKLEPADFRGLSVSRDNFTAYI